MKKNLLQNLHDTYFGNLPVWVPQIAKPLEKDPTNLAEKLQFVRQLSKMLGGCPLVVTGSTALFLLEIVSESAPDDLDLIIYKAKSETVGALNMLHQISGGTTTKYDTSERAEGEVIGIKHLGRNGIAIDVHVFLMRTLENSLKVETNESQNYVSVNYPMRIFEAKRNFGREKDVLALDNIAYKIKYGIDKPSTKVAKPKVAVDSDMLEALKTKFGK